jgi:two-component system response regulator MprA
VITPTGEPGCGLGDENESVAHVLVVDDDPSVRALLRDVLELEGHVVTLAPDGYAALRAVAAERPDCVLLDVRMPGMDGHEVLGRLRARADGLELPVVMLTAAADDATAWRGWSGGVDHLLAKPFDAEELLGRVDRLCAARRRSGTNRLRC